jgi:cell division protein FtsB
MVTRRGENEKTDITSGLRHKAAILASIILVAALVLNSFFGDKGLIHLMGQRDRLEKLRREVEEIRNMNTRLAREITALRSQPSAIERIAREELGLAREGETVFLVPENTGRKAASPKGDAKSY